MHWDPFVYITVHFLGPRHENKHFMAKWCFFSVILGEGRGGGGVHSHTHFTTHDNFQIRGGKIPILR